MKEFNPNSLFYSSDKFSSYRNLLGKPFFDREKLLWELDLEKKGDSTFLWNLDIAMYTKLKL